MSSTTDKVKGAANIAAGNVKRSFGKAIENDQLEAEGELQKAKGRAQKEVGKAKDAVKSFVDKA